jgi:hypothetical protein
MYEWLTFGEMFDRIQLGEKAIPNDNAYSTLIRTSLGLRVLDRTTGEPWTRFVSVTYSLFHLKYRIDSGTKTAYELRGWKFKTEASVCQSASHS